MSNSFLQISLGNELRKETPQKFGICSSRANFFKSMFVSGLRGSFKPAAPKYHIKIGAQEVKKSPE